MKRIYFLFILFVSPLLNSCDNDESVSPIIKIVSPIENEVFYVGSNITIQINANDPDGIIERVMIEVNDQQISKFDFEPYSSVWSTNGYLTGVHNIKATAIDNDGLSSSTSTQITLNVENPQIATLPISYTGTTNIQSGILVESSGKPSVIREGLCWNQTGNPTVNDNVVLLNDKRNPIIISGLEMNTEYHVRAFADNGISITYGETLTTTTLSTYVRDNGSIVDSRDGTTYNWVQIGNQKWFAQNLVFNGILETPYGPLYRNAECPDGWHIPNREEWDIFIEYLGGTQVAGGVLKETGTENWVSPNTGASNTAGFAALPTGYASDGIGPPDHIGLYNYTMFLISNGNGRLVSLSTHAESVGFPFGTNSVLLGACRCIED